MTGKDPSAPVPIGARNKLGRFLNGHPSAGRKPAFDLRLIAEQKAKAEGLDLKAAIWSVIKALFASAEAGDVAASKLILDKLCPQSADEAKGIVVGGITVNVLTGVPARRAPTEPRPRLKVEAIPSAGLLPSLGVHAPCPVPEKVAKPVPVAVAKATTKPPK